MKRGQLSKEEKIFILSNLDKDLKSLAVQLDRSENIIKNFIEENSKQNVEPQPLNQDVPAEVPVFEDLIGKRSYATILTKAASELADNFTKKTSTSRFNSRAIFKIKNDKPKS